MERIRIPDFSTEMPTLDMVDAAKTFLVDSGADRGAVASLDPVILAVIIRLVQLEDRQRGKLAGLRERYQQAAQAAGRLREQRNMLRHALQQIQHCVETEIADALARTGDVQKTYDDLFD